MANSIPVECPLCAAQLKVKDRDALGKLVSCPRCREEVMMRVRMKPAEAPTPASEPAQRRPFAAGASSKPRSTKPSAAGRSSVASRSAEGSAAGERPVKRRRGEQRTKNAGVAESAPEAGEPIAVWCTHCNAKLKLKSRAAVGKRIDCPKCRRPFVVKAPAAQPDDDDDEFLNALDSLDEFDDAGEPDDDYGPPAALPPVVRKKKKKEPRRDEWESDYERATFDLSLGFIGWPIGGLIGGAIGAGVWAGFVYLTGYELGYIAAGIGVLVGFGVRIMAGEDDGWGPGLTALAIALMAVLVGKYLAASLLVDYYLAEFAAEADFDPTNAQQLSELKALVFRESFDVLDLLWLALAAMAAFRIGSNLADDDE